MEQLFADRLQSESRFRLWLETLADLVSGSFREHGHALVSDLKYGVRILAAMPGFTAVAVLVTALGIGSTVSVFSVVNAVLLRSLPYGHPEKLVYLWSPNPNLKGVPDEIGINVPDFYEWQRVSHSFSAMAMFRQSAMNLVRNGNANRVGAAFVTGNFFRTLDVWPEVGRSLDRNDDRPGHEHVAVIGDRLWRSYFGSSPDVVGKQIQLNRQNYTVIGVMPKDFGYPFDGDVPYDRPEFARTDIWLPAAYAAGQKTDRTNFDSAVAIGRLREGVPVASAQAELKVIEAPLQSLYPEMWRGWSALVRPLIQTILGPLEKMLFRLSGAVGLVLLIAISNLASLLLARASVRAHEWGIRRALGAERARIVRQMLTESLLLSLMGGILGIVFAYAAVHLITRLNPGGMPRFEAISVDTQVLVLAVLLSVSVGVLAGLAPAISASNTGINNLIKSAGARIGGSSSRGRFALVVTEVALSIILLAAAGLLIRSYLQLAAVDPGFSPATLTFRLNLDERYNKPEVRAAFYRNFLEKLHTMPGVRYAGASNSLPLSNHESVTFADIRGFGQSQVMVGNRSVTPDYAKALGMRLLRGRDFVGHDINSKTQVVLINERFAFLYFSGRDPVGGQIRLGIGDLSHAPWWMVVGVVGNIRHRSLEQESEPQIFQPADGGEFFAMVCSAPVDGVIGRARVELRSLDPVLTLTSIRTMGERITESNARRSFQTALLLGFSAIAVILALAGIYGLMSYSVKQRTAELGIRLAIGSSRAGVAGLVISQGLRLAALGLLIGLPGAFAVAHLMSGWLFGVKASDPLTFMFVPLLILSVACCASVAPAWEATRIDPVQALRQE